MSESFEPRSPANPASQQNNLTTLKVPPHSVEAEQAVLGGLMVDNTEWDNIADVLMAEDFYRAEHQLIYQVMMTQSEANSPIDVVTLAESLNSLHELNNAGGLDYLSELSGNARGTANIHAYAEIIRERAILRRLISVANNIADSGYNTGGKKAEEIVDEAEQKVFNISDERPQDSGPVFVNPILAKAVERIDELAGTEGDLTGLPSGYTDLDHMTSGWQKSDLVIVAGRPSMGKTAFAMNLVENAILDQDQPVLVFSLEMPAESLIFRMLSSIGRLDQGKLRTGQLTDDDWPGFNNAVKKLKDRPLYIDDSAGVSPMEMRSRARRIKREHGALGMIVVDYLQLMQIKGSTEGRVNEISEISRSLKLLAREFECPVIALSQLNRGLEQRPNKRPVMSDLRESGAIEQDADVIAFIYRDEVYNEDTPDKGVAEVIIGKQRNGPIGTVRLSFLGQFTRFENFTQARYDDSYTHGM
ncbi:MAG TPA: replicative DNA helicase [Gammaproteobacteria bacterium]|uniref:Replicative DNA helicase n=1 Tax=OM182 bacterium TaxID=2510334 RepID=A0A520S1C2_9GAMM|nr:MAG: replicative DNA helicase [Gammaproteobacteria bacterium TMED163]RZO76254.1 MAG: replicative DNA helicase [OM182 bacterium]HAO89546.1 replicative DNA helicase [Gammaproteobacteria bacterium]HCA36635.1 replicative DNA helicase [Gammaproteobacteria bacterium]HCI88712.1 replicative DNA helicase [Gammaproteobacteria bacterium]|tara:strand:+ start:6154 stop:7572 length:1419 start_codon:yes stop_codon:yes gene_type:complete